MNILVTARLRLEPCTEAHLEGLLAVNGDPAVMRYVGDGRPENRAQTRAFIARVQARWREWGCSWWSFVDKASGEVVGAGAVQHLDRDRANPLEIGWRVRRDRWRQGLAIEAAEAMADFAFETHGAALLCAVCEPANLASSALMCRLGMHRRGVERWYGKDLETYELTRADWLRRRGQPGNAPA